MVMGVTENVVAAEENGPKEEGAPCYSSLVSCSSSLSFL